jgi:pantothenate kinase
MKYRNGTQPPPRIGVEAAVDRARALLELPGRAVLGIVGQPAAGKSTLAEAVIAALGEPAVGVPMDGFHLADTALDELGLRTFKGRIDTFDGWGYLELLRRVRRESDHPVYAPAFGREIEQGIAGAIRVPPRARLIVTEGNYLLHDAEPWTLVRDELDEVWYCELAAALRRERLLARHVAFGKTPEAAGEWVRRVDGANAEMIAAGRDRADVVVTLS